MLPPPAVILFTTLVVNEPIIPSPSPSPSPATTVTVALEGEAELVAAIDRCLAALGEPASRGPSRGSMVARVAREQGRIRIRIRDQDGRSAERLVDTPRIAAALIESWSRPDWTASLLAPRPIAAQDGAGSGSEATAATVVSSSRGADIRDPQPLIAVRIGAEISTASDGSTWMGASFGACRHLGSSCLGLEVRIARDITGAGAAYGANPAALTRLGADMLATWDTTARLGPVTLIPGAGVGGGWLSVTGDYGLHDGHVDSYGLRAEVHLLLRVPAGAKLAFEAGLGAGVSPQARRDSLVDDGFTMPGEPLGFVRGGLGLRYGGP